MITLPGVLKAPAAAAWLNRYTPASILHVFDQVCNLIDDEGEIISLVTTEIGPGPFAIVVPLSRPFSQIVSDQDLITIDNSNITLGNLTIETAATHLWQPRPDWESLHTNFRSIAAFMPSLNKHLEDYSITGYQLEKASRKRLENGAVALIKAIAATDLGAVQNEVYKLAGLGSGLTPSGDDFLIGVLYGLWTINQGEFVRDFANIIVQTAVPRTTSLSGAWLRVAAKGEASQPWHDLVTGYIRDDQSAVSVATQRILDTGHSSGADALFGFMAVIGINSSPW